MFHWAEGEHLENQLPPRVTIVPYKKWTFLQPDAKRESPNKEQSLAIKKYSSIRNTPHGLEFSLSALHRLLDQHWEPPAWSWMHTSCGAHMVPSTQNTLAE